MTVPPDPSTARETTSSSPQSTTISFSVSAPCLTVKPRTVKRRNERVWDVKPLGESLDELQEREEVDAVGTSAKKIAAPPDA